jgi:hypothetical protein
MAAGAAKDGQRFLVSLGEPGRGLAEVKMDLGEQQLL